ncbi:hypothetical protein predicted by Glimmer/Critica [Bdellovibrio bacteriovorus HD100]|uniref:Uncharacterized protein n=1 Tax=Bdellovibrio bacteriovorus (strain ATCC 15356 / DSM 50701 / NCIMB 9529 / HD100) TaxID=264462 RepID=Q6MJN3_BDEBA|nr:hypothetical protein predicted by Glimmer/Critica [Bdellovibrio bacteriovorus HD100]
MGLPVLGEGVCPFKKLTCGVTSEHPPKTSNALKRLKDSLSILNTYRMNGTGL